MVTILKLILLFCIVLINFSNFEVGVLTRVNFVLVFLYTIIELSMGRISLLAIFLFGFNFIIGSESILDAPGLIVTWGENNFIVGYRFVMLSLCSILSADILNKTFMSISVFKGMSKSRFSYSINETKLFVLTLVICMLYLPMIIFSLYQGRGSGYHIEIYGIFATIIDSIYVVIVGLWSYKLMNKYKFNGALYRLSLFFIIPILSGTRFFLLFVICVALIPKLYYYKQQIYKILPVIFFFGFVVITLPMLRSQGLFNNDSVVIVNKENESHDLFSKVASFGSNEGVLRNNIMISDYLNFNNPTYGLSFGFLFYFFIPRYIWPNKPTMLDYWLIRKYDSGFSDGHSTSSGYCGELFMDFAYFALLPIFLVGLFISAIDSRLKLIPRDNPRNYILIGVSYGWCFFVVRSILTSSFFLMSICVCLHYVLKYTSRNDKDNNY